MTRFDTALSHALAGQIVRLFGPLLREEERAEAHAEVLAAIQAGFLTRDELSARQARRLALPSKN